MRKQLHCVDRSTQYFQTHAQVTFGASFDFINVTKRALCKNEPALKALRAIIKVM